MEFICLYLYLAVLASAAEKAVYAHFMVGIVEKYTVMDWKADIVRAQEIGIDGFALNCAPERVDSYTPKQLANAYEAAAQSDFKAFISFDFAYWGDNDADDISNILRNYSSHAGQAYYDGGVLVSTFVGDYFNWNNVKSNMGSQKLSVIPMIQDPGYLSYATTGIDGGLSCYAWPTDGGNSVIKGPMTTIWDDRYLEHQEDLAYMAPVSPWFFTQFNTKNCAFICEEQPTLRWEQMLKMKPELVEIISWNGACPCRSGSFTVFSDANTATNFGESHYISGNEPNHSDDGSSQWAADFPHEAWRSLMKPYIAAYKSGASEPTVEHEELFYWYRPTPKDAACSNDRLGKPRGAELFEDVVFGSAMLIQPAELTVTSGAHAPATVSVPAGIHTFNFTMGVGQQKFELSRGGTRVMGGVAGRDIQQSCETFNYNAYVGSFTA